MNNRVVTTLIYAVIGLAIIGVISQLVTNTISFITSLFIMIGMGVAIFAVIYFLFIKRRTPNETKKYQQAVKQSQSKYKTHTTGPRRSSQKPQPTQKKKKARRRPTHLRVIDGEKSKKKRASN